MKHTTKYVALDVHQEATAATVRDHKGCVIARSVLPTEDGALLEFFRGMRGSIHVVFEEGTQAQWLHDLLITASTTLWPSVRRTWLSTPWPWQGAP